ncbi:MAG TPA: Fic family protein [Opitutaceae bacterium]|nr:Fic family protein [Opitutaceae bacterium]
MTAISMEPAFPERQGPALEDLACAIILRAGRLQAKVRPQFQEELSGVTRMMHCYYSNLIEGQQTLVPDIEAALHDDFSAEPEKRDLQKLALAHLACQRWAAACTGSPFSQEFLCELHNRFYSALPPALCVATTGTGAKAPLEPGVLRAGDVRVGAHRAPPHELVPGLLLHFRQRYEAAGPSLASRIVSIGASHHRLAWIHPFRDGNGRVIRLFSDTLIRHLGIDAGGLWSLSRGLAVARTEYYARLASADGLRGAGTADTGPGPLSGRALHEFCEFVLRVMLDQIVFMEGLFELDTLGDRIERYVRLETGLGEIGGRVSLLLREALYRGEFPRGDAGRIAGAGERTGRTALAAAVEAGLLKSLTPKSPVRLALPAKVLGTYFPRLFPPGHPHEFDRAPHAS